MSVVSALKTDCYDQALVDQSIEFLLNSLELSELISAESKVLIKPNLLAARSPSQGVTTHPAILSAVVRWLKKQGVSRIVIADSPGGRYSEAILLKLYAACGLSKLATEAVLNYDTSFGTRNGFTLLKPVLDADVVINCCKLKTHGLTVMSGAVKNLFGCIPGLKKPEWHCARPTVESFSDLLLDLCETVRPTVSLMDAIDCMEGNGPGGGTVRHMGYLLASRSPYELDRQAVKLMGLRQSMIPLLLAAKKRGFLNEEPTLIGDDIVPAEPPFKLPDSIEGKETFFTPSGLFHSFFGKNRSFPKVNPAKCVGCGKCAESCPKKIIRIENQKANMPHRGCISCFCCQEMCPAHAIEVVHRLF